MTTPSTPLLFPLRGKTALLGVPEAAGPALECFSEAAVQLAGLSILQDPQGQFISGLQLSWYDSNGATILGPLLETSPGTPPQVGSESLTLPLESRMLHAEAVFSRNGALDTLFLEAIRLSWLTRSGSARSASVFCDAHLTQTLPRETHRHILDPCDVITGCASYPYGELHFRNIQMTLARTPFAVRYSAFAQIGGPTLCDWTRVLEDQLKINAPRPPAPQDEVISCTLSTGYAQTVRIFDDLNIPDYVAIYVNDPSQFEFSVANAATGNVETVTMQVTVSGLRGEEISEQVTVSEQFFARADGVNNWLVEMGAYEIKDAIVQGQCTVTLYSMDFDGNIITNQVTANVTLDQISTHVGRRVIQSLLA